MKILWISISMTRQFWFVWMNIFQFRADNLVLAIFEFNDQTNYLTIKYVNKCKQFSVSILMMRLLCRSHLFGTSDTDYRCDWQCFKCNHSCGMYCALTVCAHFLTSLLSLQCFSMFFFCCCSLYRFGTLYDESESTIFSLFSMKYWLIELTVSISMQYCLSRLFKTPIHELNNELSLNRTFWWTKLSALTVYIDQKFSLEHQCKGLNSG